MTAGRLLFARLGGDRRHQHGRLVAGNLVAALGVLGTGAGGALAQDRPATLDWLIAARPTVADQALHEHNNVSYQQHIAIVDAIRRHDPDEADRALQSHLNSVSATWHAFGQTTNKKK